MSVHRIASDNVPKTRLKYSTRLAKPELWAFKSWMRHWSDELKIQTFQLQDDVKPYNRTTHQASDNYNRHLPPLQRILTVAGTS